MLQHVHANYEIDLFVNLLKAAARHWRGIQPANAVAESHRRPYPRVFFPDCRRRAAVNDGRGYVLRRIIRRAIRHGYKLGQKGLFFHTLVADLAAEMGDAYPELRQQQAKIEDALKQEEIKFAETLDKGMALWKARWPASKNPGRQVAFQLYDTYGFPLDLTADICRERDIAIDQAGFDAAMDAQRAQSRAASSFKMGGQLEYSGADTRFEGYTLSHHVRRMCWPCTKTASR